MSEDKIVVTCASCVAKFRVPGSAIGKRGKCPKCAAEFRVAAPQPEIAPAAQNTDDDLLSGLGAGPAVAPAAPRVATKPCPHCSASMSVSAGICPACGKSPFAASGGGGGGAVLGAAKAAAGVLGGAASFGGPVVLGFVLSTVGALIGAAIWAGVAFASHYQIGWIAWGIGALAGAGMHLGLRNPSFMGGVGAAGIAAGGIVAAKFAVFFLILASFVGKGGGGAATAPPSAREQLANLIANSEMAEVPETGTDEQQEAAWEKAHADALTKVKPRVEKMSDDEVKADLDRRQADTAAVGRSMLWSIFWSSMFGPMDILFFLLAIVTAFRIGGNGFST